VKELKAFKAKVDDQAIIKLWNPVKELKVDLLPGHSQPTSQLWNPVKELKVYKLMRYQLIASLNVESGEGIESLCQ